MGPQKHRNCQSREAILTVLLTQREATASSPNMTSLDSFLQTGPIGGDRVAGLEELRKVVLLDGIPANSEGMVGL
jgi:hypothetical protein